MTDEQKAKLREILHSIARSFYYEDSSEGEFDEEVPDLIAQIDQAYKDAGYMYISPHSAYLPSSVWYERFSNEVGEFSSEQAKQFVQNPRLLYEHMRGAAKRAAGLK